MASSICPRCGKQTDGEMVDEDLYILVVCDKCEVILGIMPKFFQKATWKAPKTAAQVEEEHEVSPERKGAPKEEPGAATLRALEKKKRADDRRLRWS